MKNKFLLKVIIGIIAVLLVFSLAACGPKKSTNRNGNGTEDEEPENNAVTLEHLSGILGEVDKVIADFASVEDELHIDVELALDIKGVKYSVYVLADIYSNPGDFKDTQGRVAITTSDLAKTPIFDVIYKGDENKVYLWQDLTSGYLGAGDDLNKTSNGQASVFSYVAGFNIAEMLGKIPTAIKDAYAAAEVKAEAEAAESGEEVKTPWQTSGIITDLGMIGTIVEGIIYSTEALVYSETSSEYKISLQTDKLSEALGSAMEGLGAFLSGYEGLIDKVSELLFGVPMDQLAEADSAYFPSLDIIVGKGASRVNSLKINYESTNRETNQLDQFGIEVKVNTLGKSGSVDIERLGGSYMFIPANYEETAVKLTLDLGAAGKDLGLKVEVIANPHFGQTIIGGGGKHTPADTAAYLIVTNTKTDQVINIDAKYVVDIEKVDNVDVGSGWLYFDLAGAFDLLGADIPDEGTVFKTPFTFFPEKVDEVDPEEPEEAAEPEEAEEPAEEKVPDFIMTDDIVGLLLAKVDTLLNFLSATMDNKELALDVPFVLDIIDGVFWVPEPDKVKVLDKDKKEVKDENGNVLMKWVPSKTKFGVDGFITLFEEMIAPFSNITGTDAEKAADVISTITGIDVSIGDILNAKAGAENELGIILGLVDGGLGFELDIQHNDGTKDVDVLSIKVQLELITVAEFEALIAEEDGAYKAVADKDYAEAIDLTGDDNIYFFTEDENGVKTPADEDTEGAKKGYVVLDVLSALFDAYKAYQPLVE